MHPALFSLPGGFTIKTYGFCLMIGFLSAVWLAMRRAARVKADPDRVLDISFFCLKYPAYQLPCILHLSNLCIVFFY